METDKSRIQTFSSNTLCQNEYHIWFWAGDNEYFPYEGMLCHCGLRRWEKPKSSDRYVETITNNFIYS